MAVDERSNKNVAEPAAARKAPLLFQERWPYCAVDASEGLRVVGGAGSAVIGEPVGGTTVMWTAEAPTEVVEDQESEKKPGVKGGGIGGGRSSSGSYEAGVQRGEAGGGWRHPVSTALAIGAATNQAHLAERERERCHLLYLYMHRVFVAALLLFLCKDFNQLA